MKNWQRFSAFFIGVALASTLTACGGGQNSTLPAHASGPAGASSSARLTITIPRTVSNSTSSQRRPQYISPATQALGVTITGGPTALSEGINLTTGNPNCQTNLLSTLVCTVSLSLESCSTTCYTGTFTTYDQAYTNASGGSCSPLASCTQPVGTNTLSQAQSVAFVITQGAANILPITLGGVPVSVTIVPDTGPISGNALTNFTLATGQNAQVTALGVDADGNYILGAGAPSVSLTTSDATQFTVSTPIASAPNQFTVTNASSNPAGALLTSTVTPTAVSGASAITATVGIVSQQPLIYVANSNTNVVTAYTDQGVQQTLSGTFPNLNTPIGVAYDPADGWLYIASISGNSVTAYNSQGVQQTLTGNWANLGQPAGITYDAANGWLYVANNQGNTVTAYDAQGNQQTLSGAFPNVSNPFGIAYDAANGWLYVQSIGSSVVTAYDSQGTQQTLSGSFSVTNQARGITYDPGNGWLYVSDGGGPVTAFNNQGQQQTLTGTFPNTAEPFDIAYDFANGWLYVANGAASTDTVTAYNSQGAQEALPTITSQYAEGIGIVP